MTQKSAAPEICLVAEVLGDKDWPAHLAAAIDATGAVTLVLTPKDAGAIDPSAARALVEMAQKKKVAALVADDIGLAQNIGADGVHLSARPDIEEAYDNARSKLGPDFIVGADAGASRHDAMTLGEAGADYVAFGTARGDADPEETQLDLVAWWADIFVVPVVAYGIETAGEIPDLVHARADFIAVSVPRDIAGEAGKAWAAGIVAALKAPASAA
ncbi:MULTISPECIES: thiamine phosphate synthase [Hyphomicrobium]|jgi:thiamine-phosphate pyrophosphorylase|uniref:thiamine phosphate synthase n=1 Tax=Hyphomicrobium TaxID=81 RepID=UPI0003627602|nr:MULTISPECIES: thiamine phosphate synthase [Hyphomicrobium]WBT39863.1 thiamine phosphate synthase [Hyphomicrobium sp. DMF-1]